MTLFSQLRSDISLTLQIGASYQNTYCRRKSRVSTHTETCSFRKTAKIMQLHKNWTSIMSQIVTKDRNASTLFQLFKLSRWVCSQHFKSILSTPVLIELYTFLRDATETTLQSSEKWTMLIKDNIDIFDNTCKKYFFILKSEVRNQKMKKVLKSLPH